MGGVGVSTCVNAHALQSGRRGNSYCSEQLAPMLEACTALTLTAAAVLAATAGAVVAPDVAAVTGWRTSVVRERLMDLASEARSPVLLLFFSRSLPARSTRKSLPTWHRWEGHPGGWIRRASKLQNGSSRLHGKQLITLGLLNRAICCCYTGLMTTRDSCPKPSRLKHPPPPPPACSTFQPSAP